MKKTSLPWRVFWTAVLGLALALTGPGLAGMAAAKEKAKLVVWWNKGYYKEEDEGMQKIAAEFARQNNVDVDITFTIQDDLGPKIISALIARRVPGRCLLLLHGLADRPKIRLGRTAGGRL